MSQTKIDLLKAPTRDGEVLIWPDEAALQNLCEQNRRLRGEYEFELLGRLTGELTSDGVLTIATGHQPGFLHPGVWIKNVLSSGLAAQMKGRADFLVVDNDALQQSALQWPAMQEGYLRSMRVYPFAFPLGWPYELLPESSSQEWERFFGKLPEQIRAGADTAMPVFLRGFLDERIGGRDYLSRWMSGMQAMERAIGVISPTYREVSTAFEVGEQAGAASFFGHIVVDSGKFAEAYNAALQRYRDRRGIRGRQHPIPDLMVGEHDVELAFWGLYPGRARERLSVRTSPGRLSLVAGGEAIAELDADRLWREPDVHLRERLGGWRIRPRALTLTMYARLLCCDLFIHGIGGAKYDQITDDCIRGFFGVDPPGYGCASATLRLALPRFEAGEDDLLRVRGEAREMRYNPQRFLDGPGDERVRTLLSERTAAVALSERLRREAPGDRMGRRTAFERIRRSNGAIAERIENRPGVVIEELQRRLEHNVVADNREWFMGFHQIERLRDLGETVRSG